MVRLAQNEINFGRSVPLQEIIDQVEAITAADIGDLAAELFREDRLAVTALGPLNEDESFADLLLT
jgi:predicted Zn-dependent peptidase